MASLTASRFVSRSSNFGSSGASSFETKTLSAQNGLRSQTATHSGLRALNHVDVLQLRTKARVAARESRRKGSKPESLATFPVIKCGSGMNLVFAGAEVGPWSKTGGLGDVLGGLPSAMAAIGHRVMTIAPRYDQYKDSWDTEVIAQVKVGDRIETVRFFHCYKRGVDRVFIDHPMFLEKAALEAPRILNLHNKFFSGPYGEDVVFIANDWHTALLPCYLKSMYKPRGMYKSAKVAFCIHNIAYQGRFAYADFSLLNLPDSFRGSFDFMD
ncbi:hypothetical protein CRG98_025706, partial [Punica granatum]